MEENKKRGLLKSLSDNIFIIIMAGFIGGLLAYYIDSNKMVEQYKSTVKIFVSNEKDGEQSYDAGNDIVLARDCSLLVANRTVMTQVMVGLDLQLVYADMRELTAEELLKKVKVCVPENSRIIYLTVTDKNPSRAKGLADAISVAAVDYLEKGFGVERAYVVESANMPMEPIKYCYAIKIIYGVIAGLILSLLIVGVASVWDRGINNKNDLEKIGVPMLAAIPIHEEVVLKSNNKKKENVDKEKEE